MTAWHGKQNGPYFIENIFKGIFLHENLLIFLSKLWDVFCEFEVGLCFAAVVAVQCVIQCSVDITELIFFKILTTDTP